MCSREASDMAALFVRRQAGREERRPQAEVLQRHRIDQIFRNAEVTQAGKADGYTETTLTAL